MDQDDVKKGPERVRDYGGAGYPTLNQRRRALSSLAMGLASTAAALAGGEAPAPAPAPDGADAPRGVLPGGCMSGQAKDGDSWLEGPSDPDPPRLKGKIAMPRGTPPPTRTAGAPRPAELPDPDAPEDPIRLRGDIAAPSHPEPLPPPPGGIGPPMFPPPTVEPPDTVPVDPDEPAPPPATTAVENTLRSVYLNGKTRTGAMFTVLVRLDPGDDEAYARVLRERKAILAAMAPLAEDPDLAEEATGFHRVARLLPGVRIRDAGVVRDGDGKGAR